MSPEFNLDELSVRERETKTPVSLSHGVHFPQEAAISAVSFLTMLINNEIRMGRTDEQFHPDNPLDQVAGQMNEATLPQDGGTVLLTTDRIKAINDATNNYFSDTHIGPKSHVGTAMNWKRTMITSRWEAAADESARRQASKNHSLPKQSKTGAIRRLILRIKR